MGGVGMTKTHAETSGSGVCTGVSKVAQRKKAEHSTHTCLLGVLPWDRGSWSPEAVDHIRKAGSPAQSAKNTHRTCSGWNTTISHSLVCFHGQPLISQQMWQRKVRREWTMTADTERSSTSLRTVAGWKNLALAHCRDDIIQGAVSKRCLLCTPEGEKYTLCHFRELTLQDDFRDTREKHGRIITPK